MDQAPVSSFEACCTTIVGDMAEELCERNGETPEQRFTRAQCVVLMIMGYLPRDVIETTLASHCVMFHDLMVASAHGTLCADDAKVRRAELQSLLALNKAFCGNLGQLKHYQARVSEGNHEAQSEPVAPVASAEGQRAGPAASAPGGPGASTPGGPVATRPAQAPAAAARDPMMPEESLDRSEPEEDAIATRRDDPEAAATSAVRPDTPPSISAGIPPSASVPNGGLFLPSHK